VAKKSMMEQEVANAIDDYQVGVSTEWRVLVATVASIMERYGVDAVSDSVASITEHYGVDGVSEFEIPRGVLEKSYRFAKRGLKIFDDRRKISRQAEETLLKSIKPPERKREESSRKNKKR
jgi:hypothetical protein